MALHGDLATLELADILQNLEMHRRSGTLEVETERGKHHLRIDEGAITGLAGDRRPPLVDDLVRAGLVTADELARARTPRWRRRRPLCEVLVERRAVDEPTLLAFVQARLVEDVCDVLALETGRFEFVEGRAPAGVFDAEERRLAPSLGSGPLLFESARRKDHVARLRTRVASEATHYVAAGRPDRETFEGDADLAEALLARLDGTRSLRDGLASFPERRFAALEHVAALVSAGLLRPVESTDLLRLARECAEADPEHALRLLRDALEGAPHDLELLRELADQSERQGDHAGAADALKLLAHLALERGAAGDREHAREDLTRAAVLAPEDASIHERRMELAREEGRVAEAIEHGRVLVALYRSPGLHAKAVAVLERCCELDPESWELVRELARSRADCGNPSLAVSDLRRHGKRLLARGEDASAREVQEEVLALVPTHAGARKTIERIDSEAYARRRRRRRWAVRRLTTALVAVPLGLGLVLEVAARLAFADARRTVADLELIEQREYFAALELFESVRAAYPWTPTAWTDVRADVDALDARLRRGR